MKVLVISAAFPPMRAGEADHVFYLCRELASRGIDLDVLTTRGNIGVTDVPFRVHPVMRDWSWRDMPRFVRFVRDCSPDAVLLVYIGWIYNDHPMMTFAPTLCRAILPHARFVTQFEYPRGWVESRWTLLTRVARKLVEAWASSTDADHAFGTLLRDSDRIVVLSNRHRRELANHGALVEKNSVLIPPPPLLRLVPDESGVIRTRGRAKLGVGQDEFVFLYFGFIYPPKGIETLLRAFQVVSQSRSHARLVLVGGVVAHDYPDRPSYAQEMQELSSQLGLTSKVTWAGGFDTESEEASTYLRAADAGVFSHDHGVYLNNSSFAAAAAHGLPIIATQAEMIEEPFVHGDNVYFCLPKDPIHMAAAMITVLDNPELQNRLKRGALKLAQAWFSWERATDRLLETFHGSSQ